MFDPTKMELGGTGTAKVAFKDSFDKDVKVSRVIWSASLDGVVVTPDEKDPMTAHLLAISPGPATITAMGESENGTRLSVDTRIIVLAGNTPATGKISVEVKPAPAKPVPAEPAKAEQPPAPAQAHH
jgi:hypothetical protein